MGWIHGRRGTIGDARFPAWRHEEAGPRVKSRPWVDGEMGRWLRRWHMASGRVVDVLDTLYVVTTWYGYEHVYSVYAGVTGTGTGRGLRVRPSRPFVHGVCCHAISLHPIRLMPRLQHTYIV